MECVTGFFFFFQAEDGIRDGTVTGVQTCALPICLRRERQAPGPRAADGRPRHHRRRAGRRGAERPRGHRGRGRGRRVRDVRRAVGAAPGAGRGAAGRARSAARHSQGRDSDRLRPGDHLQGDHRVRRDRPQDVRDVAPDAPLSHGRPARPPTRDHAPVSARPDRRGPRRHPRGRRGQDHPGDRMSFAARLQAELEQFKQEGVYKRLNYLEAPQAARTNMQGRGEVVILSSNNYLGLCNHRELESALARLVGCEAALSYVSCWNANEGLCPTLLGERDVVISDQLNHASIIDSIRLAKTITRCQTAVYRHSDMTDLEEKLKAVRDARLRLVFTDGVFSMEGDIARLPDIVTLARKYDAVVAVDDSHATGALGKTGRGSAEHYDMLGEVDIITSTLGKALGG